MVDAQGGSSVGSGGNTEVDDLHRDTTGKHGTLGDVATNILSVRRIEGL